MTAYLENRVEIFRNKWGRAHVTNFILLAAIAWIPAQIIHWVVPLIYSGPPMSDFYFKRPLNAIAATLIIAPYLETHGMRLIFFILGKFIHRQTVVNLVSSLIWGAIHGSTESWGLYAIWPFYVLGVCLLRLRSSSPTRAFWITAALHSTLNGLSYIVYLAGERPAN